MIWLKYRHKADEWHLQRANHVTSWHFHRTTWSLWSWHGLQACVKTTEVSSWWLTAFNDITLFLYLCHKLKKAWISSSDIATYSIYYSVMTAATVEITSNTMKDQYSSPVSRNAKESTHPLVRTVATSLNGHTLKRVAKMLSPSYQHYSSVENLMCIKNSSI